MTGLRWTASFWCDGVREVVECSFLGLEKVGIAQMDLPGQEKRGAFLDDRQGGGGRCLRWRRTAPGHAWAGSRGEDALCGGRPDRCGEPRPSVVPKDDVQKIGIWDTEAFVGNVQLDFSQGLVPVEPEGMSEAVFVCLFQKAWPQSPLHLDRSADDGPGQIPMGMILIPDCTPVFSHLILHPGRGCHQR